MEKGYVRLSGSGTLIDLPILDTQISNEGTIIYTVRLGIKGGKGVGIVVAAKITNPNKSRRRILADTTATEIDNASNGIAVSKLNSSLIAFKSRELKVESDPEYSPFVGVLILLLLTM